MEYSYCETVTAGSASPWHIRKLSAAGRKLGGGADALALCGIKVAWDMNVDPIDGRYVNGVCAKCEQAYQEESANDTK